jgi:hypothetical protein
MRIAPKKTDHAVLRVHGDAVAIRVLPRRRDYRTHGNIFQFADSLERVARLSPFNRKLMLVIDMLIRAATASAEIRALWRDAIRRTLPNFNQIRFGELLLFPHDFGGNQFALNGVRNKNGFALFSSDAFSAERDVLNFQINKPHFITNLLQLGVSANDRLLHRGALNTVLKPRCYRETLRCYRRRNRSVTSQ